jgi:hypothetical protein
MSSRLVRPLDAKSVVCVGRRLTILSAAEHRVDVQDIALCKIRFRQGGPLRGPEDLGLRWPPTAQERPHPPKQFNLHRLGRAGQIADHLLQRSHALSPDSGFLRIHLRTNVLSISSTLRLLFFLILIRRSPRFASVTGDEVGFVRCVRHTGPESVRRLPYWFSLIIRVPSDLLASAASKGLYPEVSVGESLANQLLSYQRSIWSQSEANSETYRH